MSDHRLAPQMAARLLGASLALCGLLVFVVTMVVVLFGLPPWIFSGTAVLIVVGVFVGGTTLTRRSVVRLSADGYQVNLVRGAGVKAARWLDVQDAVTTEVAGDPCVVLRLRDGRTTTIPVAMVATDREAFVKDLHDHLKAHGRKG